jgi:hypothetical protein
MAFVVQVDNNKQCTLQFLKRQPPLFLETLLQLDFLTVPSINGTSGTALRFMAKTVTPLTNIRLSY